MDKISLLSECTANACEFSKIDHVHVKSKRYTDKDGFSFLENPSPLYQLYKVLENGSMYITNTDKSNFIFVPPEAINLFIGHEG